MAAIAAAPASAQSPQADYDALLTKYVAASGVRYQAWAGDEADRARLAADVAAFEKVQAHQLDQDDALAFWINLYNAATLKLILDHYPLASIRDLADDATTPWQRPLVTVEGRALSLDQIENDILRKQFADARIHFALNCAAKGCPPLRPSAFAGNAIEKQLEQAAVQVVNDPRYVKVDCRDGEGGIYLSRIFEWYAVDFDAAAGSVTGFLAARRDDGDTILRGGCAVIYTTYDWSLNEAR